MDTRQAIRWDHNATKNSRSDSPTCRPPVQVITTASGEMTTSLRLAAMRNIRHCYHRAARDAHMQLPLRWLWPRRFYAACSESKLAGWDDPGAFPAVSSRFVRGRESSPSAHRLVHAAHDQSHTVHRARAPGE